MSNKGRSAKANRHASQRKAAEARKRARAAAPPPPPLSIPDHRRKLTWAKRHLDEIERLSKKWSTTDSYKIAMEPDCKGGTELVGTQLKELPDELGLIIGDTLQAMRSSLDNLAFALAIKNSPTLTPHDERDVSFPIYKNAVSLGTKSIQHMAGTAQAAVIDLCPDPAVTPIGDHPLWLLNETNNRDKHRSITVAVANVADYSMDNITGTLYGNCRIGISGPKRTSKVGDRNVFAVFGPGSQVQLNMSAALQIVFGEGLEVTDRPVIDTLRWFHDHIRDTVFKSLEPHL